MVHVSWPTVEPAPWRCLGNGGLSVGEAALELLCMTSDALEKGLNFDDFPWLLGAVSGPYSNSQNAVGAKYGIDTEGIQHQTRRHKRIRKTRMQNDKQGNQDIV